MAPDRGDRLADAGSRSRTIRAPRLARGDRIGLLADLTIEPCPDLLVIREGQEFQDGFRGMPKRSKIPPLLGVGGLGQVISLRFMSRHTSQSKLERRPWLHGSTQR